jgi:hypothetical protein
MIKRFNITVNPILSSAIDGIEASLQCSKYSQVANRIQIYLPNDVIFKVPENRELAEKGFGTCLIKSYDYGDWDASIIINMRNCTQANFTEREIAAVILHELGHILNEPELQVEPTFEFCFMHGIQFNREVLDQVRESNSMAMEIFADSYANRHGYGTELISTFYKQNRNSEQKIGYCLTRIEKILSKEYFEGKIMLPNKNVSSSNFLADN